MQYVCLMWQGYFQDMEGKMQYCESMGINSFLSFSEEAYEGVLNLI